MFTHKRSPFITVVFVFIIAAIASGSILTVTAKVSDNPRLTFIDSVRQFLGLAGKHASVATPAMATITVNSALHGTDGNGATTTLVEAIQQANTAGGSNTIVLPSAGYFPSDDTVFIDSTTLGRTMYPAITSNITIQGNGSVLDATGKNARFFYVTGSGSLTLEQINLVGGTAKGGDGASGNFGSGGGGAGLGGAIYVNGATASLTMRRASILSSVAQGGASILGVLSGNGGAGGGGGGMGGNGAASGGGGPRSAASGNTGGDGVGGNGGANNGGPGGGGGGGIEPSTAGNGGFGGGGGAGWRNLSFFGACGTGGFGGGGGGLLSVSGGTGCAGGAFGGQGGAYNGSGNAQGGGGAGLGGGIFNFQGTVTLENVTLASNRAVGGDTGTSGNGVGAGTGAGGGLFNYDGTVTMKHVTVNGNTVGTGSFAPTVATGGAIYNYDAAGGATPSITLFNSIMANSVYTNATGVEAVNTGSGTITASGAASTNIIETSSGTITGTVNTADPGLNFPARFGGVTGIPPTATSPALNTGDNANSLATDVYGNTRPAGGTVDIGAVEGVPSTAFTLSPGMLLVSDTGADAVYAIDPATSNRILISKLNFVGTGPDINSPQSIAVDSSMNIYVVNTAPVIAIIKINPTTGDRTTVSSSAAAVGTGPNFTSPTGIAIRADGKLLVTDSGGTNGNAGSDSVIVVDPANGNRTILSDDVTPNTTNAFTTPNSVIVHSTLGILVADFTGSLSIMKVDGVTGARTVLSSNTVPDGTNPFSNPISLTEDTNQSVLVVDSTTRQLIRVNQTTGARTIVSTLSATDSFNGVAVAPTGVYVTKSTNPDAVFRVNPSTGALTLAANNVIGEGFFFGGTATNVGFNLGIATIPAVAGATVSSITRAASSPVCSGASVSWTVTFAASVSGVSASNFALANIGLGSPMITGVTGSGTTWTVTASTGTGGGSLGLNMANNTGVTPTVSNTPFTGEIYTVNAPPTVANAGPDQTLCGVSATLAANAPTSGTGSWSVVSGPNTSNSQFSSTSNRTATFTPAGGVGSYTLRWTIANSPCTDSTDDVVITVPSTVVTNGNDSGAGSLRDIIANACPGSTITFAPGISLITLTSGELLIDKNLTIQGPGANLLTVRNGAPAGPSNRVLRTTAVTVNVSGLTISGGNLTAGVAVTGCGAGTTCGGGIHNSGNLTLTNSVVSGNSASGNLVLGGGIYHQTGTLTLINSTVSGNSAISSGIFAAGGGFDNADGTTIITNSTISGNSVSGGSVPGQGGGINLNFGTLTIANSTVTNNSVTGTGYGGGIFNGETFNAVNTIIVGNSASANPDLGGSLSANSANNLVGGNALLGPLQNNGGPTPTHALLPGSAAINTGNNCVLTNTCAGLTLSGNVTTDQRGIARPQQSVVDIGAFESRGFTMTLSGGNNQSAFIGTNFLNPLAVTVASAFSEPVDGGQVTFTPPVSGASATIAGTPATITSGTATTGIVTANATGGPYTVAASASGVTSGVNFSLTNVLPAVLTINRASANPVTSPSSVSWTVTFNTAVTGLTAGNFSLVNLGLTGPSITNVTGSGTTWTVTASTGTGGGSLGLDMGNSSGVTPTITNVPFTGQVYTVNLPPTTTTINNAGALATATVTGESYQVQASVSSGGGTPTGTIMVSDGTGATCSILLPATSCTLTSTTIGTKTITASYLGNASFAASTSSGVSHTVNKASTTTTVSAGTLSTATVVGQSYPVIASVAVISPGSFAPTGISRRNNPAFMPPPPVGGPTGNITVSDGSQTCTIALPATSCNLTSTTAGAKTITATYLGDANYNASPTSSGVSHIVNAASTTTTITNAASLNSTPTVVGQAYAVNWSVTVNSPGAVGVALTGNVTVSDGSQTCTAAVSAGTCNLTSATTGAKTITATYAGDANYNTSTSSGAPHTVSGAATTTIISNSVALSAVASVVGQSYSVSANVTVTSPGTGTPTGTVNVSDGTGGTCSITLSGGSGTCNLTSTTAGAKTLTATYAGDSSFNTSSGTASHTVNKASTTLSSLTDAPDPSVVGQPYTAGFTLNVTSPGAGTPTGTVTVDDGAGGTCTATLPATSCQLTSTVAGNKTVTFTYNGDANFNASPSNTAGHAVNKASTTVAITNDTPDPSVIGQNYAVTAAVSVTSPGSGTPTGTISVTDGTNSCTITLPGTSCNLPSTSVGAKTLTATYNGDSNFNASGPSAGVPHTVNKADVTVTITSDNPDSSAVGQNVTVAFTVAAAAPGAGTPTGNVTITVSGGSETCTGALAAGSGSCTLALTAPGSRTLTATYNGDSNFNGGTDTEPHTVVAPPSIAKSFSPSTAPLNTVTTLTFTITNPSSNTVALTGVTLTDNFPGAGNLVVANPLATTNTCGGSLQDGGGGSLTAGDTGIKLVGGTVSTSGTCTVSVNVTALAQGPFVNLTGNVGSTNGGTGNTATATLSTNTPPMITASPISRAAGSPASNSTIATVSDNESAAGTLVVTVTSANPSNGVTLSSLVNSNGTITANAVAACGATNASFTLQVSDGNLTATATLNVTVTPDNILPTIGACPTNISVNTATNSCAAVVTFPVPTVSDNCTGATVTCVPASGSSFAKGVTTVTCTPRDAANNIGTACSFTVTVIDNQNPTIACVTNQSVTSFVPVVVNYPAPMVSDNCAGVTSSCTPAAGSTFPLGVTTVTCTATDAVNLTASCSFTVSVNNTPIGGPVTVNTPPVTVTFPTVTTPGVTTVTPLVPVPTTPPPPNGYFIQGANFGYDVSTTAGYTGPVTVCFTVPAALLNTVKFGSLRILHLESGVWVDRTILAPDSPAPNLATLTICARTNTLSPFVLAWLVESPGPGLLASPISEKSDQKAGSVLIYNVYTSGTTSANTQNTRINLTNTNPQQSVNVHLFFVAEGCSIA
ncbi:MAG TPA: Ig-like domain repeat protein, partial [Blastocatellia bacterium]|nr:Ig-like domain repeat protein [Blastocatellia bacterium]